VGAAIVTNEGLLSSLAARLASPLYVRLFRNDVPVLPTSVLGDFETALFPDYADLELSSYWSAPALDVFGRAYATADLVWTRGASGVAETEYGWVIYENPDPDSELVCGKTFTFAINMIVEGNEAKVKITFFLIRG